MGHLFFLECHKKATFFRDLTNLSGHWSPGEENHPNWRKVKGSNPASNHRQEAKEHRIESVAAPSRPASEGHQQTEHTEPRKKQQAFSFTGASKDLSGHQVRKTTYTSE